MADDKKQNTGKRYALISKESIQAFGEAAGHGELTDEVAALLAEDVVYRLREITQVVGAGQTWNHLDVF